MQRRLLSYSRIPAYFVEQKPREGVPTRIYVCASRKDASAAVLGSRPAEEIEKMDRQGPGYGT